VLHQHTIVSCSPLVHPAAGDRRSSDKTNCLELHTTSCNITFMSSFCIYYIPFTVSNKKSMPMRSVFVQLNYHHTDPTKVKLSLWLTRHHAMRKYCGSGGIVPRILDLGTRWRWVVSFTPRSRFTPRERVPGTHCIGWVYPEPVWTRWSIYSTLPQFYINNIPADQKFLGNIQMR
jgi:hypothetical protein